MGLRLAPCIGLLSLVVAPMLAGACTADVGGKKAGNDTTNNGASGSSTGGSASTEACEQGVALANARIWRLTDAQYGNAVRQLFGVEMPASIAEVADILGDFTNFSELSSVSSKAAFAYQTAAQDGARQAVSSHFEKFLPCGPTDACAEQFIRNRVARAFGRRLDADEVADYLALFHKGLEESPQAGVRLMIEATLQSPSFLYRTELGAPTAGGPTGQVTLTPHEIATLLSFSLTNSVPDETLWAKADSNALADPTQLAAEVDRLLSLPETQANLTQLAGYWLGIERMKHTEKDTTLFPEYTPALRADLVQSAQLFVQDTLANGTVTDLLTSHKMYLNEQLSSVFNIPGGSGTELMPVTTAAPERGNGILSQPGVLAAYSRPTKGDPIHRGLFLYYALACGGTVPPPPPGALDIAKTFPEDASERELAGLRAANPTCRACHGNFDPLGLTTERYDPIGRYHETDASGAPIDQSSTVQSFGPDLDGPVDGVAALIAKLVQGRRLPDCAAGNLAVFTLGRDVKADTSCAFQTVKDEFAKTGKFRDFYRALVTSPAFIKRDVQ